MYEFLSPWGVLAPALCAGLVYVIVSEIRRKRMLHFIDPPKGPLVPADWSFDGSRLA